MFSDFRFENLNVEVITVILKKKKFLADFLLNVYKKESKFIEPCLLEGFDETLQVSSFIFPAKQFCWKG